MPVSRSGVMLAEKIVPNGLGIARPPAKGFALSAVWQATQSPASTRCLPFCRVVNDVSSALAGAVMSAPKTRINADAEKLRMTLRPAPEDRDFSGTGCGW